jgi:protein-disulfide isomerase
MIRTRIAPLSLAVIALAGCNGSGDSSTSKPAGSVAAVTAPAGTSWSQNVEYTAEGVRKGNPNATVKIVEYGSYTCPHCAAFQADSHEALERDFVNTGKLNFEYRGFARDPIDLTVSLIARCAPAESFFGLHSQLFANQEAMITAIQAKGDAAYQAAVSAPPEQRFVKLAELADLIEFAKQRGLPEDRVRACLADSKKAQELAAVAEAVVKKYPQFAGTPSFILNDTLLDATASWSALEPKLREAGL